MTTKVVTAGKDTPIEEVIELFESYRVSGLPVVDSQQRVLGIITEHDLLRGIGTLQLQGSVGDFMTTDVVTVEEDMPLVELAQLLMSTRVRRVPVTRDGRLIGVISRRDLIFVGNIRQQLLVELPVVATLSE